jgi:hypothetical protein
MYRSSQQLGELDESRTTVRDDQIHGVSGDRLIRSGDEPLLRRRYDLQARGPRRTRSCTALIPWSNEEANRSASGLCRTHFRHTPRHV